MAFIDLFPNCRAEFISQPIDLNGIIHLQQVHGSRILRVTSTQELQPERGDGLITSLKNQPLAVKVADCTAVLVSGLLDAVPVVAALHAGWRGTAAGIFDEFSKLGNFQSLSFWLSPSICQRHFEVGPEVLEALGPGSEKFAIPSRGDKVLLDLKAWQKEILRRIFPTAPIFSSSLCTYCQPEFFSYRRSKGELPRESRHVAVIELI